MHKKNEIRQPKFRLGELIISTIDNAQAFISDAFWDTEYKVWRYRLDLTKSEGFLLEDDLVSISELPNNLVEDMKET